MQAAFVFSGGVSDVISYRGVVDGGRVRLREAVTLPEGTEVIVTVLSTGLDVGEPTDEELAHLAMTGGTFDWLKDEPELYTDADSERFPQASGFCCGKGPSVQEAMKSYQ